MNEFKTDHLKQSVFIFHPALPLSRAEPHIAVVLRETLVVKRFKRGGTIYKSYYHGIYICISAISRRKKGYSNLFGMNNLD